MESLNGVHGGVEVPKVKCRFFSFQRNIAFKIPKQLIVRAYR
jgi:hypothetical protein